MTAAYNPDDRWSHTFKRVLIYGDTFKSPFAKKPVKFDVDSMRKAAQKFNNMMFRYGEYRPTKRLVVNYSKLIVRCNYIAFTSDLELICEIITMQNQYGVNLKKILLNIERNDTKINVQFIPRFWGNFDENNVFFIKEIIAIDVKLQHSLLKFILNTKNVYS